MIVVGAGNGRQTAPFLSLSYPSYRYDPREYLNLAFSYLTHLLCPSIPPPTSSQNHTMTASSANNSDEAEVHRVSPLVKATAVGVVASVIVGGIAVCHY